MGEGPNRSGWLVRNGGEFQGAFRVWLRVVAYSAIPVGAISLAAAGDIFKDCTATTKRDARTRYR